jgi:hypothetical protein
METYVRFYAYLKRSTLNIYRSQRNIGIKAVDREGGRENILGTVHNFYGSFCLRNI